MVYASPETAYIKKFKPFLEKKKRLAADEWGVDLSTVQHLFQPLEDWLVEEVRRAQGMPYAVIDLMPSRFV